MAAKHFLGATPTRCYTRKQVCERLQLARRTFFELKKRGQLPLIELLPRLGRVVRYHAEPIDRYLAGRGRLHRAIR